MLDIDIIIKTAEKKQSYHKRGCFYHIRTFFYLLSKLTDLPQITHRFVFYTQKQWLSQYGMQKIKTIGSGILRIKDRAMSPVPGALFHWNTD